MRGTIGTRLRKLEGTGDALDRWIKSLSDEELDTRIDELTAKAIASLEAAGVNCAALTTKEMLARLDDLAESEKQSMEIP